MCVFSVHIHFWPNTHISVGWSLSVELINKIASVAFCLYFEPISKLHSLHDVCEYVNIKQNLCQRMMLVNRYVCLSFIHWNASNLMPTRFHWDLFTFSLFLSSISKKRRNIKDFQFSTILCEKHMQYYGIYFCLSLLIHTNKSHLHLIQSKTEISQIFFFSNAINVSNHFSHIFQSNFKHRTVFWYELSFFFIG